MPSPKFDPTATGPSGLAIANHVVRVLSAYTGRGATKARTGFRRRPGHGGRPGAAHQGGSAARPRRSGRSRARPPPRLPRQTGDDLTDRIEGDHRTPRIAFLSANHIDPDIAIESFVLAQDNGRHRDDALASLRRCGSRPRRLDARSPPVLSSIPRPATRPSTWRKQQRFALCSLNPRWPVAWIGAARLAVDPHWRCCSLSHCVSARKRSQTRARTISSCSPERSRSALLMKLLSAATALQLAGYKPARAVGERHLDAAQAQRMSCPDCGAYGLRYNSYKRPSGSSHRGLAWCPECLTTVDCSAATHRSSRLARSRLVTNSERMGQANGSRSSATRATAPRLVARGARCSSTASVWSDGLNSLATGPEARVLVSSNTGTSGARAQSGGVGASAVCVDDNARSPMWGSCSPRRCLRGWARRGWSMRDAPRGERLGGPTGARGPGQSGGATGRRYGRSLRHAASCPERTASANRAWSRSV